MKSATSPLLLALCLLASAATAARTDEGTWSLAGSLMVDTASYVGTDIDLDLYAGQYVQTGFLLGGYAGVCCVGGSAQRKAEILVALDSAL